MTERNEKVECMTRLVRLMAGAGLLMGLAALAPRGSAWAAQSDFYVGGSIGAARVDYDASTFAVGSSGTGYEVAVGFQPLPVLAAEVNYVGFPRAFAGINYADTYGVGLDALAFLPIPVVQVFGKVGMLNWHTDAHSAPLSFTRTGTNIDYGGGAATSWGKLGARLEFERFDVVHARRMQLTSIGLTWAL